MEAKSKKLHIKKGDAVIVIAGNAKGQQGSVSQVLVEQERAVVSGVNMRTKHLKPNAQNTQGSIIKVEGSIHVSNLMIVENGNPTRTGRKLNEKGKLQRFSKKTGNFIK